MHPPVPRKISDMSAFANGYETRRVRGMVARRTEDAPLQIPIEVKVLPRVKESATFQI